MMTIFATVGQSLGCFIAESIQGVGGTVQFPKGYLQVCMVLFNIYAFKCQVLLDLVLTETLK